MIYPVLEFREEKQTFAKVERGNMDFSFFIYNITSKYARALQRENLRKMKIGNAIDLDNIDNTDQWPTQPAETEIEHLKVDGIFQFFHSL